MKTTRGWIAISLVLVAASGQGGVADLGLPTEVAGYRSWRPLLEKPHPVSLQLWTRCMAPTPADWEAERRRVGLHAERYIMVYGNAAAVTAAAARTRIPAGAIIAKAKLRSETAAPDGVAFMIKRTDSRFSDTGSVLIGGFLLAGPGPLASILRQRDTSPTQP